MNQGEEIEYVMRLAEAQYSRGEPVTYTCGYCCMPLAPLFETKVNKVDYSEDKYVEWEDEPILCPACGQEAGF